MKAYYVYNEHSRQELELLERVFTELGEYSVELLNSESAKQRFHFTQTPALIVVREDLQGEHLLSETVDGKLRVYGEVLKIIEEEEKNIHNHDTARIDTLIKKEVALSVDEAVLDIIMRGGYT